MLIGCCVAVLILLLGLLRFRVETDPQRLWVGRGSRALGDKQAYEVCYHARMVHTLSEKVVCERVVQATVTRVEATLQSMNGAYPDSGLQHNITAQADLRVSFCGQAPL